MGQTGRVNAFWEWMGSKNQGFFIDAATAFSWDAKIIDVDNPDSGNIFNQMSGGDDYLWQDWNGSSIFQWDEPSPDALEEVPFTTLYKTQTTRCLTKPTLAEAYGVLKRRKMLALTASWIYRGVV